PSRRGGEDPAKRVRSRFAGESGCPPESPVPTNSYAGIENGAIHVGPDLRPGLGGAPNQLFRHPNQAGTEIRPYVSSTPSTFAGNAFVGTNASRVLLCHLTGTALPRS